MDRSVVSMHRKRIVTQSNCTADKAQSDIRWILDASRRKKHLIGSQFRMIMNM